MKKYIIVLFTSIFLLVGCTNIKPSRKVEEFLTKYQALNDNVLSDLELSSEKENIDSSLKSKYVDIFKRVYQNMTYEITDENIDGDEAIVTVNINVYDLYKAKKDASLYLQNNPDKFLKDGLYSDLIFQEYELDKMLNTMEIVSYTLSIKLEKVDNEWSIVELDNETKEKIHGIYNYENK